MLVLLISLASGVAHGMPADGLTGPSGSGNSVSSADHASSEGATVNQTFSGELISVKTTGPAVVGTDNGTTYLWPMDPFDIVVTIDPGTSTRTEYSTCLLITQNDTIEPRCQSISVLPRSRPTEGRVSTTFTFDHWPLDTFGPHRVDAALNSSNTSTRDGTGGSMVVIEALDPSGDLDSDGLTNQEERDHGTDPIAMDTDRDGLTDKAEINEYGTDPRAPDSDGDGLRDGEEIQRGTNPAKDDTDGDGVFDGVEMEKGTDPMNPDTDGDGLDDGHELSYGTDPLEADSDQDGISDGRERRLGTDPLSADTDGDMLRDAVESRVGTNPTSAWVPLAPITLLLLVGLGGVGVWITRSEVSVFGNLPSAIGWPRPDKPTESTGEQRSSGPDRSDEPVREDPPMMHEEQVLSLLDHEGGRVKQAKVVEMTDWSKAKVSRVLSGMEESGEIIRIKIGRENLVCLEEHVPKGVQSPFED